MYIKVTEGVPSQKLGRILGLSVGRRQKNGRKWRSEDCGPVRKNEVNNNQTSRHKQKVVEIKKRTIERRRRERKNIYSCWAIYPLALLFNRNVGLVTGELIGWPGDGMEFSFYMWWWWWWNPPPQYNQKLGLYMYRSSIYTSPQFMSCSSSNAHRQSGLRRICWTQSHYPMFFMMTAATGWLLAFQLHQTNRCVRTRRTNIH